MNQSELEQFMDQLMFTLRDKFKYWRTYSAVVKSVNDTTFRKGYVGLECLELLAKDEQSYIWAKPVTGTRSYQPPKVGDNVILFFKNVSPDSPRFFSEMQDEFKEEMPKQKKYTLVKTASDGSILTVEEEKGFTLESKSQKGSQSSLGKMVLGEKLKDLIDSMFDDYIKDIYEKIDKLAGEVLSHNHNGNLGAPTSPPIPPATINISQLKGDIGSKKGGISQKKQDYAKDGNLLSHTNKNN